MLQVPEDREARVELAIGASIEALKLARREAEGAGADPARLRWVAVGIVSALQGGLVAALSGYETAATEAVRDPSHPERIAPVAMLLRRARSEEYLNPPERVELPGSLQRALERILAVRNAAVHALRVDVPERFAADALAAAGLIEHLVLQAPAFDPAPSRLQTVLIGEELKALRAALTQSPRD